MQSRKRFFRLTRMLLLVVLLLIILLPRCISIRMSDQKVQAYFKGKAVQPVFGFVGEGKGRVHYARLQAPNTVADSLPIALFIHGSPGAWDAFISFFTDSTLYTTYQLISVDRPGFGKSNLGKTECADSWLQPCPAETDSHWAFAGWAGGRPTGDGLSE